MSGRSLLYLTPTVRERLTVLTQNGGIARAEHKLYVSSESDEDDSDSDDRESYWGVLSGVFWTLSLAGGITIFSIYFLWSVRKTLNNRFQGRMAILAALIIGIAQVTGANAKGSNWSELWAALEILCFVGVGRGISTAARPKWLSLEQLCRLAPIAKATGDFAGGRGIVQPSAGSHSFSDYRLRLVSPQFRVHSELGGSLQSRSAAG